MKPNPLFLMNMSNYLGEAKTSIKFSFYTSTFQKCSHTCAETTEQTIIFLNLHRSPLSIASAC